MDLIPGCLNVGRPQGTVRVGSIKDLLDLFQTSRCLKAVAVPFGDGLCLGTCLFPRDGPKISSRKLARASVNASRARSHLDDNRVSEADATYLDSTCTGSQEAALRDVECNSFCMIGRVSTTASPEQPAGRKEACNKCVGSEQSCAQKMRRTNDARFDCPHG